jgi:transcription elongation factor/antiterminator RfaH
MNMEWYALNVKPHKERAVHQLLRAREVEVFFPTLTVKPKNPRAAKVRPYFPGYMFVRIDLADLGTNALKWTPGTRGLVAYGGEPAVVPRNLIQELKSRLAEIEASGGLLLNSLRQGDRVRILRGPFAGYEAIFDMHLPGKQRVQVLLAFLSSHPQPMKLDHTDIEKLK